MNPLLEEVLKWTRSQTVLPDASEFKSVAMRTDAQMVRRVLTGDDGPAFLLLLARLTVLRPALDPRKEGPASHDYAQRRTGENAIFAAIVHYWDGAVSLERTDPDDRSIATEPRSDFGWGTATDLALAGDATDERFGAQDWDAGGEIAGR